MTERNNIVTYKGTPLTLIGPGLVVTDEAPEVILVGTDMSEVSLATYEGKVRVMSTVPSLDTPVCDLQTRRFNEEAGKLGDDVVVLTISMDLPFAQKRWCGAAGADHVITLSDHHDAVFGKAYGVLIRELRLLTRAVFVVDREGIIRYVQIVPEMTDEPDYDAALAAVASLTK
jgi:thiol peroxidase